MKPEGCLKNNVKALRTRMGLSQQRLAEGAGVTRQTVSGLEGGLYAASAAVALRLARELGCRVEELFWLDDDFPKVEAVAAGSLAPGGVTRVALAQVNGRWMAHPLLGERAFRMEMIPADGTAQWNPEGQELTVQLLDHPDVLARTVVVAGCTPALSLWARSAERWHAGLRVHWTHANSMDALHSLARGEVHAAGLHLLDPASGEYNSSYVRRAIPDRPVVLVNLGVWEEGLLVRPGNPKELHTAGDLCRAGVVMVNRERGAGSRLLLDTLLREAGVDGAQVTGYGHEVCSHQAVAQAVLSGEADAGFSASSVAATYGLDFIALCPVRYDLAILADTLQWEPLRQFLS
nr:helix-turn-helix domain-containing protein [Armatimonadota bacterium]